MDHASLTICLDVHQTKVKYDRSEKAHTLGIEKCAPQAYSFCTQTQCLKHIRSAADSSVDVHYQRCTLVKHHKNELGTSLQSSRIYQGVVVESCIITQSVAESTLIDDLVYSVSFGGSQRQIRAAHPHGSIAQYLHNQLHRLERHPGSVCQYLGILMLAVVSEFPLT